MNKLLIWLLILTIILLILTFDKTHPLEFLKQQASGNRTLIYDDLTQGHHQNEYFESKYFSEIYLDFNIIENHIGEFDSAVAVIIYNTSRDSSIKLKYINNDDNEHLQLTVLLNGSVDLSESITLNNKISRLHVSWDKNNIYLKANGFDHVMNIPFTPSLIGISSYSVEILNTITLIGKNND